ncbi:MAG: single-stranded-DNA-specific exonuclease [Solirubrobacteraceae bacterium]|nr:single-stranded-DNA-specific exonuclease [Solirubrobacteraceae bacterium]
MSGVRLEVPPASTAEIRALEAGLGVSGVLAEVLVRRGLGDPDLARAFMRAEEEHPPSAFAGIERAVDLILGHVRAGSPITVHGDYDCDGVCSTAVYVRVLRRLGANVDWFLPDRRTDGYGLAPATVDRLAARGTRLLLTADCAITAVEAVAAARAAGMDVVVSDHHSPRADGVLPDAPIVHPAVCGYPFDGLCATAVAAKLAAGLREAAGGTAAEEEPDLELVALATVADVVPLRGENRRLVRAGLRALAGTASPGLRALMAVARVSPLNVDEQTLGFRLAPRINAAGRLYRPDVALELLLTEDPVRAAAIAGELDRANAERRLVETRIRFEAEAQVTAQGEAAAYVLAGEGWHPGVVGIVAARIAERHRRPTVMIALEQGRRAPATGSARSIPAFDLLGGLNACAGHLRGHGGHRAAAGLQIDPDRIDGFRAAFAAHAASVLAPEDLIAAERVDAVVSGEDLGLGLAEELLGLAPFGAGNPPVSLLLAAATLEDPVGFGGEERTDHVRFSVWSGGARARAVSFGGGGRLPVAAGSPVDATFRLERNEWQGVVAPRLLLRQALPCAPEPIVLLGEDDDYLEWAFRELTAPLEPSPPARAFGGRTVRDRRGRGIASTIAGLVATGEPVLVLAADGPARNRHLRDRLGGFALCSHAAAALEPELGPAYDHVVVLDPPATPTEHDRALAGRVGQAVHLAWGEPEHDFARRVHEREHELRAPLGALYRALRDRGGAEGGELEAALRGDGPGPRSAPLAGRMLRVLAELDLVELDQKRMGATVVSGRRANLEASPAFRSYQRRLEDGRRYLASNAARAAA